MVLTWVLELCLGRIEGEEYPWPGFRPLYSSHDTNYGPYIIWHQTPVRQKHNLSQRRLAAFHDSNSKIIPLVILFGVIWIAFSMSSGTV